MLSDQDDALEWSAAQRILRNVSYNGALLRGSISYYEGAKHETVVTNDDEFIGISDHKLILRVKPYLCPAKRKHRLNVSGHYVYVGAKNETVPTNDDESIAHCDHEPVLVGQTLFSPR